MPYLIKDFENRVTQMMYMTVRPFGWVYDKKVNGVPIEFGYIHLNNKDPEPSMCMRVKGTTHYWAWFQTNFNQLAKGDYADLFTKQLEEFRIEFLLWIKNPDSARLDWVREYYEIFKGCFYDFSPQEQEEYRRAQAEWDRDQSEIDSRTRDIRRYKETGELPNQEY